MKTSILTKNECSAMRGIAIMAIMLHNYCHWLRGTVRENEYKFYADRAAGMWQALFSPDDLFLANMLSFFGHYGVPVFLFLSGFGLVLKYENPSCPRYSTYGFMRVHYLKLLRMMVPGFVFFIIIDIITPRSFHFYCDKIIEQGLMIINIFPEPNKWIWPGPYWFFGLMLELYLIYRLLLYRRSSWIVAVAIVVGFLAQVFCDPTGDTLNYLRYNAVGGILPFGCGILAARHLCGGGLSSFSRWQWCILTVVSSALVVVMSLYELSWYFTPVVVILATICLVKSLPDLLLHWSVWLGGISAAMFVTHPAMRKIFIPVSHRGDVYDGLMLYVIAAIGVAWVFEIIISKMKSEG